MATTTLVQTVSPSTMPARKGKSQTRKNKRIMNLQMSERSNRETAPAGQSARVKRFHSKSRKGCYTCRQRRVKCDEQRNPNCARCEKGNYICEWQDTRRSRSRLSDDKPQSYATRSPSLATTRSDDETGLSPRFFSDGIVTHVSALFTDMAESFLSDPTRGADVSKHISDFYYVHVFQASVTSPIIRKALTALCGLYDRAFASSVGSSPGHSTFIAHYSEAVTDLRYMSRDLPPDVVLMVSILFANCEYLMEDLCSAMQHLQAGARILREHTALHDERISPELNETLSTIFEVFGHHSIQLDSPSSGQDAYDILDKTNFEDLNQANDNLLQIYFHTFALKRVRTRHPQYMVPALHGFQRWSNSWAHRTSDLEQSLTYDDRPWLQLLHGQHQALNSVINQMSESSGSSLPDDQHLNDLVLCISSFFQMCPQYADSDMVTHRPFLDNIGLILPLFIVTLRCPDAETCRTALSLLGRLKIEEGVWNSCCAYTIAEFVIAARQNMAISSAHSGDPFHSILPTAEIRQILPLTTDSIEVSVSFPQTSLSLLPQETSTAIVGSFCACSTEDFERLRGVIEDGGYQGPVTAQRLENCRCQDIE